MPASALTSQDASSISPPSALPPHFKQVVVESSADFKLNQAREQNGETTPVKESSNKTNEQQKIDDIIASFGLITREKQHRAKAEKHSQQLAAPLPLKPLQIVTTDESDTIIQTNTVSSEVTQSQLQQVVPHLSQYHAQMQLDHFGQTNHSLANNGQANFAMAAYYQQIQEMTSAHLLQQQPHQINPFLPMANGGIYGQQATLGHFTDMSNISGITDFATQHLLTPTNYLKSDLSTMYWPSPSTISTPSTKSFLTQPRNPLSAPVTPVANATSANANTGLLGGNRVFPSQPAVKLPYSNAQNGRSLSNSSSDDSVSTKILVKFLPITMKSIEFQQLFSTFGRINNAKLIHDKTTGKSLGYGFVTYESIESAETAVIKMNECVLTDRPIKVMYAQRPDANEHTGKTVLYVSGLGFSNSPNAGDASVNNTRVDKDELAFWFGQCGHVVDLRMVHELVKKKNKTVEGSIVETNITAQSEPKSTKTNEIVPSSEVDSPGLYKIVAFITFSTCSDARRAIETLHGKTLTQASIHPNNGTTQHTERLCVKFSRDASKNGEYEILNQMKMKQMLQLAREASATSGMDGTGQTNNSTSSNALTFATSMSPSPLGMLSPTLPSPSAVCSPTTSALAPAFDVTAQRSQLHEYLQYTLKINQTALVGNGVNGQLSQTTQGQSSIKRNSCSSSNNTVDKTVLFVHNLPFTASEIDLILLFSSYGPVLSARVIRDVSGLSKGFGFVNLRYEKDAAIAVQTLNEIPFGGKNLKVEYKQSSSTQKLSKINNVNKIAV